MSPPGGSDDNPARPDAEKCGEFWASGRLPGENRTLNTAAERRQECRKLGKLCGSKLNSLDEG